MESNDTLLTATQTGIDAGAVGEFTFSGAIGDNPNIEAELDVDLYAFELTENTRITFGINNRSFMSVLNIFDAEGNQFNGDFGPGDVLSFQPQAAGTYYLGISGFPNFVYDPNVAGSGSFSFPVRTGNYELVITKSELETIGLVGGAQLVKDINPDAFRPRFGRFDFAAAGGKLFFTADDGITGRELWVSDGTADGTQLVKDINPDTNNFNLSPDQFTEFNGKLFFTANDGITGRELWVSDGTADGTQLVKDINPSTNNYEFAPINLTAVNGKLFFTADNGTTGRELWVSDGTAEGTQLLKDINTTDNSFDPSRSPDQFTEFDGKLFFSADDGITGQELWVSDGTAEGTQLLKDINTTTNPFDSSLPSDSRPFQLTEFNGKLFFSADDGITGQELWVSDGTAEGTQLLKDINPDNTPDPYLNFPRSDISDFTAVDGKLFFTANDGITGQELWVSDGTAEGTQLLKDINTTDNSYSPFDSRPEQLTAVNGKLFFTANDGITGRELWVSDGTAEGTQLLKNINPDNNDFGDTTSDLTVAGNLLFFTANDSFLGRELWVSDGTAEGTQLFQDINPGDDTIGPLRGGSNPEDLTVVGDQLFFSADDGTTGAELWAVTIPDQLIVGDENNNVLKGTKGADLINGLGGNDIIRGRRGNDILNGNSSDDILWGNRGDDTIGGGTGNDQIFGNQGRDDLHGGNGDDFLSGGANNDTLNGDSGDDFLRGEKGNDQLTGGAGQDSLFGGQGADTLTGGIGNDFLRGGRGADIFQFEADLLDGIADTDTIQRFESEDSLDFSAYLNAGGSIDVTWVTSRLLRIELGGEDSVDVMGNSHALDVAQSQL